MEKLFLQKVKSQYRGLAVNALIVQCPCFKTYCHVLGVCHMTNNFTPYWM
jgi:hypothetical protein